jgi:lipoic acid synthetase
MPKSAPPPIHPKPPWLRRRLPRDPNYQSVRRLITEQQLHTVCQAAACPNQFECFSQRTATFLILGDHCTRNCRFCNIEEGPQEPLDRNEPQRVAEAAAKLQLRYVVVTSVTRDDLPDGGAQIFKATIKAIYQRLPDTKIEVLIPDFNGDAKALETVLRADPTVLNHNVETVAALYPAVRPQADYHQSLELLRRSRKIAPHIPTKSGIMLGLGESSEELEQTLEDILATGCRLLTIGQYLQPTKKHLPVSRYVTPEEFERWKNLALNLGFKQVASGPFVRSSYNAHKLFIALC